MLAAGCGVAASPGCRLRGNLLSQKPRAMLLGMGVRGDSLSPRILCVWLEAARGATGERAGGWQPGPQAPPRALGPPHSATRL